MNTMDSTTVREHFLKSDRIERIILFCDIDGVVRESVEAAADPRILASVEELLEDPWIDVTFISGTPIQTDQTLEVWRRGNTALGTVFNPSFTEKWLEHRVAVYGVLGSQKLTRQGDVEIVEAYPSAVNFELCKLLLNAFLKEIQAEGHEEHILLAQRLEQELEDLQLIDHSQPVHTTPREFESIISVLRTHFDPALRLISSGSSVETQTSYPLWKTVLSCQWLQERLPREYHLSTGCAKRADRDFNFLLITQTHKGLITKRLIDEKLKTSPRALVITIGDTQIDYPMHQNAHLAFHVGARTIWQQNPLPHCFLVCDSHGNDHQHVEGTLSVLEWLKKAKKKSLIALRNQGNFLSHG